ncbi:MAG: helix-turn-helix transcriptional regulator [Clostridia bacterium]|nr:helix-turn-helix transcriptional regulator [Clostridia bacterium]
MKRNQLSKEEQEIQISENNRKKEIAKMIGNNINKYRKNLKLTREQLAEKSHITSSHLYQLEIGNSVPSIITIIDICNALNITPAQLTDDVLYNSVNKFTETIANDFDKLSDKNKDIIIQLIKYMENS